MDELDQLLSEFENDEIKKEIDNIIRQCKKIIEKCIDKYVVNYYSPEQYMRTKQIKECWKVDINNDAIELMFDFSKMKYHTNSIVQENITELVPYWVNYGHYNINASYPRNQYDMYEGRYFLEAIKEEIENQLGIECNLIVEGY